jgi:predicted RNase H-like HicB family nuclease
MFRFVVERGERVEENQMNYYEIIVYWSIEDNSFIAEVPELAGCMANGKTYIEALQNTELTINEWIETAQLLNCAFPASRI